MRDRVVLWTLVCGVGVALLAWEAIGPWPAMVLALLAVVGASLVYRIERPRIDLDDVVERLEAPGTDDGPVRATDQ